MQASLWHDSGAAPAKRPRAIRVRSQRGLMHFDSKASALYWADRHAPLIPAGVRSCSAHPRAVRTDSGSHALVYDVLAQVPEKWVLGESGWLIRR